MRMPAKISCFVLSLLLVCGMAHAETSALFLFDNLRQWLDFTYQYDGHTTSSKSGNERNTRQHRFEESYNFSLDYSLYNPQILNGSIEAGLLLGQEKTSGIDTHSGGEVGYRYNIDGILFERRPHPMTFFTRSETMRIRQEFSRGYTLNVDSSGAGMRIRNRVLPTQINYIRSASDTSGLLVDRELVTDRISVSTTRKHSENSTTEIYLINTEERTSLKDGSQSSNTFTNEFSARNISSWGQRSRYSLLSLYRYREQTGLREEQIHDIQESLTALLGRALDAGADYEHEERKFFTFEETRDTVHLWLRHKVLDNFKTRLEFRGRQADLSTGEEVEASGFISMAYEKRLPKRSRLQLDLFQGYGVTDRNFHEATLPIVDEPHVASFVTPLALINPNVIPDTVTVRSSDPLIGAVPYQEGESKDYILRTTGAITEIIVVPGGAINDGESLLISYSFTVNPSVTFSSSSTGAGFLLSLLENQYRIYGNWSMTDQDLLEGRDDQLQLVRQRTYVAGAERTVKEWNYGAEYYDYWSSIDARQSVEGFSRFSKQMEKSSISAYARDRVSHYETTSRLNLAKTEYHDNIFTIGGIYNRSAFDNGLIILNGSYVNTTGGTIRRDDISAGATFRIRYGNTVISLKSQVVFRYYDSTSTREDYLRLDITRYL